MLLVAGLCHRLRQRLALDVDQQNKAMQDPEDDMSEIDTVGLALVCGLLLGSVFLRRSLVDHSKRCLRPNSRPYISWQPAGPNASSL